MTARYIYIYIFFFFAFVFVCVSEGCQHLDTNLSTRKEVVKVSFFNNLGNFFVTGDEKSSSYCSYFSVSFDIILLTLKENASETSLVDFQGIRKIEFKLNLSISERY
jgi:hypothetical protein